jgi:hypothetical protein
VDKEISVKFGIEIKITRLYFIKKLHIYILL